MEMPIDLYLTFEDGKIVSYKYTTMVLFVSVEFEVEKFSGTIEFPNDLDTYVEDEDIFVE